MLNNWIWIESDWFPSHFLILIYGFLLTCANLFYLQNTIYQHIKTF
jgi:hypothetical protein